MSVDLIHSKRPVRTEIIGRKKAATALDGSQPKAAERNK
jgi:hypothetical protein